MRIIKLMVQNKAELNGGIHMKAVYPIILTPAENGYVVSIPSLCLNTEGDTIPDAIAMARDAIGLWGLAEEDAGRQIPAGSASIPACEPNEVATLVDIDFAAYRQANDMRAVRKNCTIPSWLNEAAEAAHLNFSSALAAGLKQQLNIE